MQMEPIEFLMSFVEGNLDDFRASTDSVRKGINAALSAFHMSDHYFAYFAKHDRSRIAGYQRRDDFLRYLASRCPAFLDIQSIANVYKHLYCDTTRSHVMIDSAGAIGAVGDGETEVSQEWHVNTPTVIYRIKTGEVKPLLPALEDVFAMWWSIMREGEPGATDNPDGEQRLREDH